jgi:hypothetical protein
MIDQSIRSLGRRILHDVSPLGGWSVRTEGHAWPVGDAPDPRCDVVILLGFEGRRTILTLEFFLDRDYPAQAIDALNQLQDVVVETSLQPWPSCPSHSHVMVPMWVTSDCFWVCPADSTIAIRVGDWPVAES